MHYILYNVQIQTEESEIQESDLFEVAKKKKKNQDLNSDLAIPSRETVKSPVLVDGCLPGTLLADPNKALAHDLPQHSRQSVWGGWKYVSFRIRQI